MALDLPGVAIEDCNSYSVFAVGSAAAEPLGGNALQVVVAVDATAEAEAPTQAPTQAPAGATPPPTDTLGAAEGSPAAGAFSVLLVMAGIATLGAAIVVHRRRSMSA